MPIPSQYREHAHEVLAELKAIGVEIERLMTVLGDRRRFSAEEVVQLRSDLKELKAWLAKDAHYGTMDGEGRIPTPVESIYFEGVVRKASAYLSINANSSPGPMWMDKLYGVSVDIGHGIAELEAAISESWDTRGTP